MSLDRASDRAVPSGATGGLGRADGGECLQTRRGRRRHATAWSPPQVRLAFSREGRGQIVDVLPPRSSSSRLGPDSCRPARRRSRRRRPALLTPDSPPRRSPRGEVIAVGLGRYDHAGTKRVRWDVKTGDVVLYSKQRLQRSSKLHRGRGVPRALRPGRAPDHREVGRAVQRRGPARARRARAAPPAARDSLAAEELASCGPGQEPGRAASKPTWNR